MNKLFSFQVLYILLFSLVSFSFVNGQSEKSIEDYQSEIETLISTSFQRGLFNGNVLVSKDNEIIYQKSFGYSNIESKEMLNDHSIFNIGSIAKQINATSVMILHEQKKLDIDNPISTYNLDLPKWSERVTLRHLINYAGGLPKISPEPLTDEEVWAGLRSNDSLHFEPGTDFNYNNNSVFLQKRIVEKISGLSFEDFVMTHIIRPLGMKNSVIDPKADYANRTNCFQENNEPCPEYNYHSGWLWFDAPDLLKWVEGMNENKLVSKESFEVLLHNPYAKNKTASNGQYLKAYDVQRHDGTMGGFEAMMYNGFSNNIKVIVLSNNKNIARKIGEIVYFLMNDMPYTIPKKSFTKIIAEDFFKDYRTGLQSYNELKSSDSEMYAFDDPSELNNLGYALMGKGKKEIAIEVFKLAVEEFPTNANAYDSLGEGYFENKQYDLSIANYQKVIEMSGPNDNAELMIKKIQDME